MSEPKLLARSMETTVSPAIEIVTSNDRLDALIKRAESILESQTTDGEVRQFIKWPRRLRREFSRIAAKVNGQ